MAAATNKATDDSMLYMLTKVDQKLAESFTRIILEFFKEGNKTTELPENIWKDTYLKTRNILLEGKEKTLIACLDEVIKSCEQNNKTSVNDGILSLQLVTNIKKILELRAANADKIKKLKETKIVSKRKRKSDDERIEEDTATERNTAKITLTKDEIFAIRDRLLDKNKLGKQKTVIRYEAYERAGSLAQLKKDLEEQLLIKLKMPQINRLGSPLVYREQEVYFGKRIWFNVQILPIITIERDIRG